MGNTTRMLATAAVLACTLAACGGDDEPEATPAAGGDGDAPFELTVGVIPIAPVAPLFLGIQEGFFDDENLSITPEFEEGGVNVVTAVIAGEWQMGFSNTLSLMTAAEQGLPVQMLTAGVTGEPDEASAWGALIVKKGGDIESAKDLEGETVAVNTLNNVPHLVVNRSLQKQGADYKKVEFVEVAFPEAAAAVDEGRVAAAWVVEPFVTNAVTNSNAEVLLRPYIDTAPNLTVSTYFTSAELVEQQPEVVERFARAMNKSLEFAQENPDAVRAIVTEYTEIPPEAAANMALPTWTSDMGRDTMELTIKLGREYGFLEEGPNLDELIWEGAQR